MRNRAVHYAVAGTKKDGAALVPWCPVGYAAFRRFSQVVMNTIPSAVDCKHCKVGLAGMTS